MRSFARGQNSQAQAKPIAPPRSLDRTVPTGTCRTLPPFAGVTTSGATRSWLVSTQLHRPRHVRKLRRL